MTFYKSINKLSYFFVLLGEGIAKGNQLEQTTQYQLKTKSTFNKNV